MSKHMKQVDWDDDELEPSLPDGELDDVSAFWASDDSAIPTEPMLDEQVDSPYVEPEVPDAEPKPSKANGRPKRKKWSLQRKLCTWIPIGCIVLVTALFAFAAMSAWNEVGVARKSLSGITNGMKSGDAEAIAQNAVTLAEASDGMRRQTDSPIWTAACALPVIGNDLYNVQLLARVLDDVAKNAIGPVSEDLAKVSPGGLMHDGALDVEGLTALVRILGQMDPVLARAKESFGQARKGSVQQLNRIIEQGQVLLEPVCKLSKYSDTLAEHLPQILGANDQTRHYLILAESNAELRSVGGFAGSWGLLSFTNGQMELGEFSSPQEIRVPVAIDEGEQFIYGAEQLDMVTSAGINPHFPRVASIVSDMYIQDQRDQGDEFAYVDGVVAVDPLFLQEVMRLTHGSLDVEDIHVDETNTASLILSRVYWEVKAHKQDAVFAAVAQKAFDMLVHSLSDVDVSDFVSTIETAAQKRDICAWFLDNEEQEVLRALELTGALHEDQNEPYVGVFLNDYTWSKIDWYLSHRTDLGEAQNNGDGTVTYHVTTRLENHMTPKEAKSSPEYVIGGFGNPNVTKRGEMLTYILFLAPAGGEISDIQIDDEDRIVADHDFEYGSLYDFSVVKVLTRMLPTESLAISYDITVSAEARPLQLDCTPTAQEVAGWTTTGGV